MTLALLLFRRITMTTTFSRNEAFSFGWNKLKTNLSFFILLCLASFLVGVIQQSLRQAPQGSFYAGTWLASLALQVVNVVLGMAWIKASLRLHDTGHVEVAELVPSLQLFLNYILTAVLYGLVVAAGLILLIVPGILWAVRYGFFGFLVIDKQLDPIAALKRSAELTRGRTGELLVFGLMLFALNIAGALAFGVGLFATVPTSAMAAAYVYRRLLRRAEEDRLREQHVVVDEHAAVA
jgi:uncharacterized membrane protein